MKNIAILQPSELGSDFSFNAELGVWTVNFPAPIESVVAISPNVNNLIATGTDGGAYVDATKLIAHSLVQDTVNQKIHLYRFPAGTVFTVETATLVGSIDMVEMNGVFDDVVIAGNTITFRDAQTNASITLDTDTLQRVSSITTTNSIRATTVGGELTLDVIVDPAAGNLLTSTVEGLEVNRLSVEAYISTLIASINSQQSVRLNVAEGAAVVRRTIGNQGLDIPQLAFVDSSGQHLAYADDVPAVQSILGFTVGG